MSDMSVGTSRTARSIIALLLIGTTVAAQAEMPAWLSRPAWQQPLDAVKAAEGESAVTREVRPGSQLAGFDLQLSTPAQAGDVPISRQFYFDATQKLALIRIVPLKTDTRNCDALLAATL
ncbi:MAG: hypothetical protein J7485_12515 [Sphingobium sp.]|nr:hypothetical protein [Sphingobium sp.]